LSESLLEAIQPKAVIVADSEYPATERASARLRQRLASRNFTVLYTRFTGTATVSISNRHWEIQTMDGSCVKSNDLGSRLPTRLSEENQRESDTPEFEEP
jgi:hypothetical protein